MWKNLIEGVGIELLEFLVSLVLWVIIYFVAFTYYSVKFRPYRAVLCCILSSPQPSRDHYVGISFFTGQQ